MIEDPEFDHSMEFHEQQRLGSDHNYALYMFQDASGTFRINFETVNEASALLSGWILFYDGVMSRTNFPVPDSGIQALIDKQKPNLEWFTKVFRDQTGQSLRSDLRPRERFDEAVTDKKALAKWLFEKTGEKKCCPLGYSYLMANETIPKPNDERWPFAFLWYVRRKILEGVKPLEEYERNFLGWSSLFIPCFGCTVNVYYDRTFSSGLQLFFSTEKDKKFYRCLERFLHNQVNSKTGKPMLEF